MSDIPAPAKQSASVAVVRDGTHSLEVLMLRRNQKIAFHGGDWVFPGGRVDACDTHTDADSELVIARRTAAREALEEAGLEISVEKMLPFAHWTTPAGLPKRFATWFFAVAVDADSAVQIDNGEIVDHRWLAPQAALHLHEEGELSLPAPTYVTLLGFEKFANCAALNAHLCDIEIEHFAPRLIKFDGGRCTLYTEDAGYETLDMDVPGARHRVVVHGTKFEYLRDF
jgi:8-oxo-dGTP pyrophosphatase MutT (NUDIX family)